MEAFTPVLLAPLVGWVIARAGAGRWWLAAGAVVLAVMGGLAAPGEPQAWANCVLGWALLALAWVDARHFRLPDLLTLPLILLGLAATWWLEPWRLTDHAIGAIAGYLTFRLVAWAYARWRGHEGLGQGDAKLLAAGGAWLGWEPLSWVVMLAALTGIGWVVLRKQGLAARSHVAFGPFLAVGIWVMRLLG